MSDLKGLGSVRYKFHLAEPVSVDFSVFQLAAVFFVIMINFSAILFLGTLLMFFFPCQVPFQLNFQLRVQFQHWF